MRKNGGVGGVVSLKPLLSALVISGLRISLHKRVGATKPIVKAKARPIIKTGTRAAKPAKPAKPATPKKPLKPSKPPARPANKKKTTMKGGARSDFFE
jgi:hypothetical protein